MVTSLTLKAPAVRNALATAVKKGLKMRVLAEREVAWKADYAGAGVTEHLIATEDEKKNKKTIGSCEFFIGATKPGESREKTMARDCLTGYHWHVAYVIALSC